jgi:Cation efflux family
MSINDYSAAHEHVFLGEGHEKNEMRAWLVIWLCGAMMIAEIVGGLLFGSIALVADGLHMSTHAGALLPAALAYTYARKRAGDPTFTFGTEGDPDCRSRLGCKCRKCLDPERRWASSRPVRLVDLRLQHRLHVPRLNTNHRQAGFGESAEKPFRQRPGFQPNPLETVGGVLQHLQ